MQAHKAKITRMDTLKSATLLLAAGVEAAGAIVIGLAAIEAFLRALMLFVPHRTPRDEPDEKEAMRLKLGRWLAVALELELGADILRTAVAPTWNEIGQLAAIVILRTALNYFLQREIDQAEARGTRTTGSGLPVLPADASNR
jgi:uncharacterized membrane protein